MCVLKIYKSPPRKIIQEMSFVSKAMILGYSDKIYLEIGSRYSLFFMASIFCKLRYTLANVCL